MTENRKKALALEYGGGAMLGNSFLTTSEIEEVISETPFTEAERKIAVMRYVERRTLSEIADAMSYDVRTIQRKMSQISPKLCETLLRIIFS